ncbi:MAG: acetyl esterase [Limisphaerales bacterium]|jgi:acetyl esterase
MTLKRISILALALLTSIALAGAADAQSKKKSPKKKKPAKKQSADFAFKGSEKILFKTTPQGKLHLHVFKPRGWKADDARPGIVFFFGGGWSGGTPGQFEQHCNYLASRGMVAITAEYRVRSRHKTSPFECVEDGKSAVRWVRAHAGDLGIDPKRLAAGGGSAGGHVAAATATTNLDAKSDEHKDVSSIPNALALFNPVYDNGPKEYGHDRVKDRFNEISPAHNIHKGMPPAIVFFGSKDSLVSVETAKRFQSKMREVGSKSVLKVTEGAGHGYFNYGRAGGKAFIETVTQMDEFFAELGWLKGKPKVKEFVAAR